MMIRFLREPLVQFLLLGAALFSLYALVAKDADTRRDRIVIDAGQVTRLAQQFQRTWMRPPSRAELDGLIEDHVQEEILYREALALGLDRDDLVIRRRLRQKMDFLNQDIVEQRQPTEAELQAFFNTHQDKFRLPERLSFSQVYVNPGKRGPDSLQQAATILADLNRNAPAASLGDATLLPGEMNGSTPGEIAKIFGDEFSAAIEKIPVSGWAGPITSSYGLHLVRVTARESGKTPLFADVRPIVEREWSAERRVEANRAFYAALRKRYEISIIDAAAATRKGDTGGK